MTLPFYPFYWGDYSAKTFNLTNTQHGIYILLLRNIYTGGEPMETVEQCYSVAKASTEQTRDVDLILLRFFVKEKGVWTNKKALRVMKDSERVHQVNVIKGKKGGRPAKAQLNPNLTPAKAGPKQLQLQPIEERKKDTTYLSKEKRGARLPDNFDPDASCHELAESLLLTNQESQGALENFLDYWRAVPGAKGVKLDWQATFRNQLRHVAKQKGKPGGKNNPNSIKAGFDVIDRAVEELRQRESSLRDEDGETDSQDLPRLRQVHP